MNDTKKKVGRPRIYSDKMETLAIALQPEELNILNRHAKMNEVSKSSIIRKLIRGLEKATPF